MISAGGGAELSSRMRVRCAWSKFRELSPILTSRGASPMIKGKINNEIKSLNSPEYILSHVQLIKAIKDSSNNNSTGPDKINIKHLKHLDPRALDYLLNLYNLVLNTNIIPIIWKTAKIIPIPKPNKSVNEGSSYRPISLLSPIAKTLEKIILPSLSDNIPQNISQHGFKSNTPPLQHYIKSMKP